MQLKVNIIFEIKLKAVEISSESEPDEIDDLSGIEDIRVQD